MMQTRFNWLEINSFWTH